MPAKKKRKPKHTSGVLCRDRAPDDKREIVFFIGAERRDIEFWDREVWVVGDEATKYRQWTLKKWQAAYKLTPPRPGQAFECDVEL